MADSYRLFAPIGDRHLPQTRIRTVWKSEAQPDPNSTTPLLGTSYSCQSHYGQSVLAHYRSDHDATTDAGWPHAGATNDIQMVRNDAIQKTEKMQRIMWRTNRMNRLLNACINWLVKRDCNDERNESNASINHESCSSMMTFAWRVIDESMECPHDVHVIDDHRQGAIWVDGGWMDGN